MERPAALKNYNPYRFLVIFFLVGLIGHFVPVTRRFMLVITPLALLISGITILIPFIQNKEFKALIFFCLCGFAGFFAEVIGVNYGILFGNYSYGSVLGFAVLGVPLIIGFNWIIILAGSLSLAEMFFKNQLLVASSAAAFAVIFDFIMEPVAVYFKYWVWFGNNIPLLNYFTWGIIIFIFSLVFVRLKLNVRTKLPAFLFVILICYFLILKIAISIKVIN